MFLVVTGTVSFPSLSSRSVFGVPRKRKRYDASQYPQGGANYERQAPSETPSPFAIFLSVHGNLPFPARCEAKPPNGWKHASMDLVMSFLQEEVTAGRFEPCLPFVQED